jgi:transposase
MNISDSLQFSFAIMLSELEHLRDLKKRLLIELRKRAQSDRYKESVNLLRSVPGIGPLTSIRLIFELGNVDRFKRKEEFSSFLGLTPSEYSSGEQERKGHITRQGNRWVRSWLIESSWVGIRHDPVLLEKFITVYKHCGSKKKAIVAVARKMGLRLRALLLSGQPYVIGVLE